MDKDVLEFVTFCIGNLARQLKLSQLEVYLKLKDSLILSDYIVPCYNVLHTFSKEYILEDLSEFMKDKGVLDYSLTFKESIAIKHAHEEAYHCILESKYTRIIAEISQMHEVSLEQAMDIFYTSELLPLLEDGVADLHCRSDKYLAEEIWRDFTQDNKENMVNSCEIKSSND